MNSQRPTGDGPDMDPSAYDHHFSDFTQGSIIETDQSLTTRSTRFGNGKAPALPLPSRQKSSALSTPTRGPRFASRAARREEPSLPRYVREPSLPTAAKHEPQLPRPSKKVQAAQHESLPRQAQYHQDMAVPVPDHKAEAQSTAVLPDLPNITELVSGVYENGTPIFSDYKKRHASRWASASQVGESTNNVSLPDVDQVHPKYDEKKLLASIRYLEDIVIELQHHQAESEHTLQYLRQKAFESESKGRTAPRRSDSALGSISGGSDGGEDKLAAGQRKLMIEKNRFESTTRHLESRVNALNDIALAYQNNIDRITQERDTAVSQLGVAYFTNEQLKQQNDALRAENAELRHNVEELIANQEESTMGFEVNPNMTAREVKFDRIMYEKEQAENTRQKIKASLRARRQQATEPVPDLPSPVVEVSDNRKSQPASPTNGERRVTINDVSLDVSYLSFVPGAVGGVRQNLEDDRVDGDQSPTPTRQQESIISYSEPSTPVRGFLDTIELGTPDDESTRQFLRTDITKSSANEIKNTNANVDDGETSTKAKPVRKVTPFPINKTVVQPTESEASMMSVGGRRDAQSEMTSAWIVPDITIDFPEPPQQHAPQVSQVKEDLSGGEQSDSSQSTVERVLHESGTTRPSLLDDDSGSTVERIIGHTRKSQRSLLDDRSKIQRSLLDDDSKGPRSLLDDDSKSVEEHSLSSRETDDSRTTAERNLSISRPLRPSLLDHDSNSVVVTSNARRQTKRTRVIPRPVPVSDRMPVPGQYEEEPTIRPSQPPGIALATVLKDLQDELSGLKRSAKKYQQLYDSHDPALSKRSRKSVFEKIQTLNKTIDAKADQIYSLYDVLEGQKQQGQEMSQEEVEVTLQSIGIEPEQAPSRCSRRTV